MASQTTGIQQLLGAEKRAAEKVAEARKRKARRLKQAKEEAQAEIDAYKAQREKQYREHENSILGSRGDMEAQIDKTTRRKIDELNSNVKKHQDAALSQLLKLVYDINPELHQNYRM
ncbi:V-type proton ATPase subunit G-like [Liolophura sinensis]|uniref:V-type proton ATPase subunit G-like n=1 Tax=Liolophura sinensis TaxID=3198878 RepID=UPI0031588DE6